jgi:iron complex outermembrane receptor protein
MKNFCSYHRAIPLLRGRLILIVALAFSTCRLVSAQEAVANPASAQRVVVTAELPPDTYSPPYQIAPDKLRYDLPQTTTSTTADNIQQTVNAVDSEDALKYLPSLFVRKRNYGDTQAVLATRTWGLNSSARTLVYADDILLSALIGNNNTNSAPRWGLVSPEEIERIDFLYGPFAAAYPGNSEGGVLLITTKMPKRFTASLEQTEAFQAFDLYGTSDTYRTDQTNIFVGDKQGNISWLATENFQNSESQPLAFITSATSPAGTTGIYPQLNKLGLPANVAGAGGLLQTEINNLTGKVAWDVTPTVRATYELGYYYNNTDSDVQTYLRDSAGDRTFAGIRSFATNNYNLEEDHLANSLSIRSNSEGFFDWDLSASSYYYLTDIQRSPYNVESNGTAFTPNGNIARLDGTNWVNADARFILRPLAFNATHEISFGLHFDRYDLDNPTYATPTWNGGPDSTSALYSEGLGTTWTEGLWAQDAWRFAPDFKLTIGGRLEHWGVEDGFNLSTTQTSAGAITSTTAINQPSLENWRFSPKLSLDWAPNKQWEVTANFGQGYRFPTVSELYQIVSTGPTFFVPNPNLKPEDAISEELAITRKFSDGFVRLSFFNENDLDALISQTNFVSGLSPTTFISNVDSIRNTGVELAADKDNVFVDGVDLFGSVTYVDSEILSDPSFRSTTGTTADGKRVPYVPDWRVTFGTTYRPDKHWALTAALRYSGTQYSTLDNTDNTHDVFGAFDPFVVVDLRAQYKINKYAQLDLGVDNVTNDKYFLYHPFPQRTFVAQVKLKF